ncbi:MAG TPA: ABC transporter permease subunit, partial [Rhizobiaceae bacterium]|nr:ABC transporter permease subunit [Rhizobiaceae bacterium]
GVRTLTFAVYSTWLNRGSLEGAAQLACVMLFIVMALLMTERWARRRQRFHANRTTAAAARPVRVGLLGWRAIATTLACGLPVMFGFVLPVIALGGYAWRRPEGFLDPRLADALLNTVGIGLAAAVVSVIIAFALAWSIRQVFQRPVFIASRIAISGYAVPGTILALGLLYVLSGFDNAVDTFLRSHAGVSSGLLLSGTPAAIIIACVIRFLAVADGNVAAGFAKLSPNLDQAARTLGHTPGATLGRIILPLMRPAILTAAALVFVDTTKELSATILLRPFGFNTLATYVYENASRAQVEDAVPAALVILMVSIVPALLLSRELTDDRPD